MRTVMKKLLSIAFAATLALSLSISAFADGPELSFGFSLSGGDILESFSDSSKAYESPFTDFDLSDIGAAVDEIITTVADTMTNEKTQAAIDSAFEIYEDIRAIEKAADEDDNDALRDSIDALLTTVNKPDFSEYSFPTFSNMLQTLSNLG